MNRNETILLVDDEANILQSYRMVLRQAGFNKLICCNTADEAQEAITRCLPDLILLDLTLKGQRSGKELLPVFREIVPEAPVIIISGNQDIDLAVDCMRRGARDYLSKPIDGERLKTTVLRTLEWRQVAQENRQLRQALLQTGSEGSAFVEGIVTRDHVMRNLLAYARIVAHTPEPVLITGESGVGKEMFARAIHNLGDGDRPWVAVNVTALDDDMFTDALFGHSRGAFTGANKSRPGLLEKAFGGTLLLDEIGDLSLTAQAKLLRLIQEKEYHPVGSDTVKRSECRIIATTNRSLEQRMKEGTFRSDLYYRLNVHHLHIPPLRERRDDILFIAEHFMQKTAQSLDLQVPAIHEDARNILLGMSFPGNVRQLEALIYDAVVRYKEKPVPAEYFMAQQEDVVPIDKTSVPVTVLQSPVNDFSGFQMLPTIQQARLSLIDEAIRRCGDNRSAAARMLGITPQALHKHMKNNA